MIPGTFDYHAPETLDEALWTAFRALKEHTVLARRRAREARARPLADAFLRHWVPMITSSPAF